MSLTINDTPLSFRNFSKEFLSARPFPHLIIDDFLPKNLAENIYSEIGLFENFKKSNDYIFAKNKYEFQDFELIGPSCAKLKNFLASDEMAYKLTELYGVVVKVDANFTGGGLHRGGAGSYLDMHADFALHPGNHSLVRELNVLLYLNKGWKKEYGGSLDLKNAKTGEISHIEPIFNRLVIMLTKDFTLHGYKPIKFPDGEYRTSIATYAYSENNDQTVSNLSTTTLWVPEGKNNIKNIIARYTPKIVSIKQKFFGSKTAKK